ncbi:MAG: hypothetical protein GXX85_13680 [Ignavibacteria bacterium]|nr:hypothetical protein [Ignavibacteria bacterium]
MEYLSINPASIEELAVWQNEIRNEKEEYFEIKTKFIRPFCVVFFDQLFQKINKEKKVRLMPWHKDVHHYLNTIGFEFLYGSHPEEVHNDESKMIKLRRFKNVKDDNEVVEWIESEILPRIPQIDSKLNKGIVANFYEIINNSMLHSTCEYGLSVCGQFYPAKKYFELAFYDAGIGLANKVKNYGAIKKGEPDSRCIKWALQEGTSTRSEPNSGIGLFLLQNFIKINGGNFHFISGDGFFKYENYIENTLKNKLHGTLINLRIYYNDNNCKN